MHENQPGFASRGTGLSFFLNYRNFFYINKKKNELKKL